MKSKQLTLALWILTGCSSQSPDPPKVLSERLARCEGKAMYRIARGMAHMGLSDAASTFHLRRDCPNLHLNASIIREQFREYEKQNGKQLNLDAEGDEFFLETVFVDKGRLKDDKGFFADRIGENGNLEAIILCNYCVD
jgi:hypothetical protein